MSFASQAAEEGKTALTFQETLRVHQAMVFSIAYHFLRDPSAAEEIAQDVFLQLYRRFDEIESVDHARFWLRKTASHRAIDYVRKHKKASVALEDIAEPSVAPAAGDPFLNRKLQALIASLPETPRMLTILRYQEEMMPEEIAETLDMPVRTVKSHLHRALTLLREKMARTVGDSR